MQEKKAELEELVSDVRDLIKKYASSKEEEKEEKPWFLMPVLGAMMVITLIFIVPRSGGVIGSFIKLPGEYFVFSAGVTDISGIPLNAQLSFIDPDSGVVRNTKSVYDVILSRGIYDIVAVFDSGLIIKMNKAEINSTVGNFMKVDFLLNEDAVRSYAFSTNLEYDNFMITGIAMGNNLKQCPDWDFYNRTCNSEFEWVMKLTPGQGYNLRAPAGNYSFIEVS